jgi:acetoacetyl-CoA synthetase
MAVPRVPRTLSGKKLEVPVKRILLGEPADKVASAESLLDPRSLAPFLAMARAGLMKDIAHGHEEASP